MIAWRSARALIAAVAGIAIVGVILIATAWYSRRGDYSDCLRTAAAIRPGQSKADAIAVLSRHSLIRNSERQVMAICDPTVRDVRLPYYPVMALEIEIDFDDRGRVASVQTNDVPVWLKRDG